MIHLSLTQRASKEVVVLSDSDNANSDSEAEQEEPPAKIAKQATRIKKEKPEKDTRQSKAPNKAPRNKKDAGKTLKRKSGK